MPACHPKRAEIASILVDCDEIKEIRKFIIAVESLQRGFLPVLASFLKADTSHIIGFAAHM